MGLTLLGNKEEFVRSLSPGDNDKLRTDLVDSIYMSGKSRERIKGVSIFSYTNHCLSSMPL